METFSEGCLFSVQIKVPLAFYLNLFGITDTQISPLTGNVNNLYIAYIPKNLSQLFKSVSSDTMAYLGLCFWITLQTKNSVEDQIVGKGNLRWEENIKRVNGMIPKDVKPSSSYPQIFYTIARNKNKQKEH